MRKRNLLFSILFILFHTVGYAAPKTTSTTVYRVSPSDCTDITAKNAVHTDIVAYINGKSIPSYNINSHTGIVAEDLINYGFDVSYNDYMRQLVIEYNKDKEVTANYVPPKNHKTIGSFAANVYQTDIVTRINGKRIAAYNIGGKTILLMDSLAYFGDVNWYPNERKICFDIIPPWEITVPNEYDDQKTMPISSFTLELTKNEFGEFEPSGENYQYLSNICINRSSSQNGNTYFDFAIYQNVMDYTLELITLLDKMYTLNIDRNRIQQNADFANKHMEISINGEKLNIIDVTEGMGNGHKDYYFTLNNTIKRLEDIQTIKIVCK